MATKTELAVQALEKSLIRLEMEAGTLRDQMKMLGEQVDRSRTMDVPDLKELVGRLDKDLGNLRGEFDKAILRIEKSIDWSRDVWKAVVLILFTAIVSIAVSFAKDFVFPGGQISRQRSAQEPAPSQPQKLP